VIYPSGKRIDPGNIVPADITDTDLAHVLGRLQRWGGCTKTPITVAEHLIYCQNLANRLRHAVPGLRTNAEWAEFMVHLLLHDAHEVYIMEIRRPLQKYCKPLLALAPAVDAAIYQHFETTLPEWLPLPVPSTVMRTAIHWVDEVALVQEGIDFMPKEFAETYYPKGHPVADGLPICFHSLRGGGRRWLELLQAALLDYAAISVLDKPEDTR